MTNGGERKEIQASVEVSGLATHVEGAHAAERGSRKEKLV